VQEVSLRACYLFSRLAKLLRQPLARFLPDILASLQVRLMSNWVATSAAIRHDTIQHTTSTEFAKCHGCLSANCCT